MGEASTLGELEAVYECDWNAGLTAGAVIEDPALRGRFGIVRHVNGRLDFSFCLMYFPPNSSLMVSKKVDAVDFC